MSVLSDKWIRKMSKEEKMISPFEEKLKNHFKRISFDLIYGLPGQNEKNWEKELTEAINLSTEHISAYQLTIEKGPPFYASFRDKKFTLPK